MGDLQFCYKLLMPPSAMQCATDQTMSLRAVSENSNDAWFTNFCAHGFA